MIQREEGLHCCSGVCMHSPHCAVEGDSATTGHVFPLYGRSPGMALDHAADSNEESPFPKLVNVM